MSARDEVLARVRSALGPTRAGHPEPPAANPPTVPSPTGEALVELFVERVADYRAVVVRCAPERVAAAVRDGLGASTSVIVPEGFPFAMLSLPLGCVSVSDAALSADDLDGIDAVVTTASVGIATTGTIVLDHGAGQGRRALSLVPDRHVCVVRADQVVAGVMEAVTLLGGADPTRPLTWISGPSATSDIELDRVEGVHGPRTLVVVVVGERAARPGGQ